MDITFTNSLQLRRVSNQKQDPHLKLSQVFRVISNVVWSIYRDFPTCLGLFQHPLLVLSSQLFTISWLQPVPITCHPTSVYLASSLHFPTKQLQTATQPSSLLFLWLNTPRPPWPPFVTCSNSKHPGGPPLDSS